MHCIKWVALVLALATGTALASLIEEADAAFSRQDYRTAASIYRSLAGSGDSHAQFSLGALYDFGYGAQMDKKQAVSWYRKSAEQGSAMAQFHLGHMYAEGQGVLKDEKKAVSWFRKAADQGNDGAQCNLGLMYASGTRRTAGRTAGCVLVSQGC